MTIDKTQENGKLTLVINGKLDTTTAPQFKEVLIPSIDEARQIELDLTKLSYISSAGLRVLLLGQKTATANGVSMTLCGVSEEIKEILEMTGFVNILKIV